MYWLRDLMLDNLPITLVIVPLVGLSLMGAISKGVFDFPKWALIAGFGYIGFVIPVVPALMRHSKMPLGLPWYIYAAFAGVGAIVGYLVWTAIQSDKPAEPRW